MLNYCRSTLSGPEQMKPADQSGSILELASFHSLRLHSLKAYTAYNASLQPFYTLPNLPASPNRPVIIGLYLLALLSSGQLTDFHTLLERLEGKELEDSFVKLPVDLWVFCLGAWESYEVHELMGPGRDG